MPIRSDCWFQHDLDEGRWWLEAILVAVAIGVGGMKEIMLVILAFFGLYICIYWDRYRWRWPFLPQDIGNQILEGEKLLNDPHASGSISDWQDRSRTLIETYWGRKSEQMRQFKYAAEPPDDVSVRFPYGQMEILREQVRVLKKLKSV